MTLIHFDGTVLDGLWGDIQGIFQETFSSLLIFNLILPYSSQHTHKKKLTQNTQKHDNKHEIFAACYKTTACPADIKICMRLPHDTAGPARCGLRESHARDI